MEEEVYVQENVNQLEVLEKLRSQGEDLTTENENEEQNYKDLVAVLRDENNKLRQELQQKTNQLLQLKNDLIQDLQLNVKLLFGSQRQRKAEKKGQMAMRLREPVQESHDGHNQGLEERNDVLKRENEMSKSQDYHCGRLIYKLLEEVKKLKYDQLQHLQYEGKVCSRNCVISVILWICKHKLGELSFYACGHQLRSIITFLQAKNITKIELRCEYSMELFERHGIVMGRDVDDYKNPTYKDVKDAWETLMMTRLKDEKVCIMGIQHARYEGGGHCVVLDMESKTDGKVMMCDPQMGEDKNLSEEDFMKEVTGSERLRLYTVNWERLKALIREHSPDLHKTHGLGFPEEC